MRSGPDRRDEQGAADLVVHVAAQVPRHRLEPGERVDRGPRLRPVVEAARVEDRVLDRDLGGVPLLEVGVDALGVLLERGPGLRLDQGELLRRRSGASPWCGRTGRSPAPARRTAPRAGRPSRAGGRPSRRSAPGRARTPGRASGRRWCRRRSAGCRGRRGPPSTSASSPASRISPSTCGNGRRTSTTPVDQSGDQGEHQHHDDVGRPAEGARPAAECVPPPTALLLGSGARHGAADSACRVELAVGPAECQPVRLRHRGAPCPRTSTPAPSAGTPSSRSSRSPTTR